MRALAGEQPRALVQLPEHLVVLERLRDRFPDHLEQPQVIQPRLQAAGMGRDLRDGAGTAAGAARPAVLVAGGDLPGAPADRAGLGGASPAVVTSSADPQAAGALDQPHGLV